MAEDQIGEQPRVTQNFIQAVADALENLPEGTSEEKAEALVKSLANDGYGLVMNQAQVSDLNQEDQNLNKKLLDSQGEQFKKHLMSFKNFIGITPLVVEPNIESSGAGILFFEGMLDSSAATRVHDSLAEALKNSDSIIIDFSRVTYISSASLGVLIHFFEKFKKLSIINVPPEIYNVFSILGLDLLFDLKKPE